MPPLARAALWYAGHGWHVFPCVEREKVPAVKTGLKMATKDERQVKTWWHVRPRLNIGLACGPASGLYALDIDQHGVDGEAGLDRLIRKLGDLPATIEQTTGGGGRQLLFAYPGGRKLRNKGKRQGPGSLPAGVDTRGDGGYVVIPPSIHPSGIRYRWRHGHGPHERQPAALPSAWIEYLEYKEPPTIAVPIRQFRSLKTTGHLDKLADWTASQQPSNRNSALYWATRKAAVQAKLGVVSVDEIKQAMHSAAVQAGLDRLETIRTINSALRAEGLS